MFLDRHAIGLEISQSGPALVLAEGKSVLPTLVRYATAEFPPETLRVSFKEANIINPAQFVATVRDTHLKLCCKQTRVSVALPDATGRVLTMDLDTRFKNHEEGVDLIRWKLKKSFPLDVSDVHLDYQQLQQRESGEISVLVALVSRGVVTQYEDLLVEAGLEPFQIDFATLNVFHLLSQRFEREGNTALVSWFRGSLGVMVFTDGVLEFYRHKEIPGMNHETNRLYREVNSSLLVYRDRKPGQPLDQIFFATDMIEPATLKSVVSEASGLDAKGVDLDPFLLHSREKIDRRQFSHLAVALATATRNLR